MDVDIVGRIWRFHGRQGCQRGEGLGEERKLGFEEKTWPMKIKCELERVGLICSRVMLVLNQLGLKAL
jgi:hypothetical protein